VLLLINNGEAIRDFIHIDNVVNIYKNLLIKKDVKTGTCQSKSILFIIDFLRQEGILLKTVNINRKELKVSICNTEKLKSIIGNLKFKKVKILFFLKSKECE